MKETYEESARFLLECVVHDMKQAGHRVLHEPKSMAMLMIGERSVSRDSITSLQTALAKRFGTAVSTDTGRATLSIAHDRVELTDQNGRLLATDAEKALARIGLGKSGQNLTVTLDALATKMVRWYAEENGRDIADVVNGVVAGEIGHLFEQEEEGGVRDDTSEHLGWYLVDAIQRRSALRKAA